MNQAPALPSQAMYLDGFARKGSAEAIARKGSTESAKRVGSGGEANDLVLTPATRSPQRLLPREAALHERAGGDRRDRGATAPG